LEYKTKEKLSEILKLISDDLNALNRDVKKVQQNDKVETDYFKNQLTMLMNDKTKIHQNYVNLDNRIIQCETDVGIRNNS